MERSYNRELCTNAPLCGTVGEQKNIETRSNFKRLESKKKITPQLPGRYKNFVPTADERQKIFFVIASIPACLLNVGHG
jgi:hypothetical protein